MHLEVAYPVHTDYSNLDLIPRPASQRGPSPLERLKVISIVARKPGRKEGDKLMVTAAESKRGPSKIQSLNLSRGRVNDSQLPRVSPCLAASIPTTSITWLSFLYYDLIFRIYLFHFHLIHIFIYIYIHIFTIFLLLTLYFVLIQCYLFHFYLLVLWFKIIYENNDKDYKK